MADITVREYARLTTDCIAGPDLDRASVSLSDFDELCALNDCRREGEAPLFQMQNRHVLCVRNYVGVLQTSLGTRLEILPKTSEDASATSVRKERGLLIKMLETVLNLAGREGSMADIRRFDEPLQEWVIRRFLEELHALFKKGLRFQYNQVEADQPFLRGRLDVGKQAVQPPQRRHLLHIRYNRFSVERPEHRLLRRALDVCMAATRQTENLQLAAPLRVMLADIPPSVNVREDLRQWSAARHMAHYQRIRHWCELVLGNAMPFALAGEWRGISMLFPMEKLFEKYVGACLRRRLCAGATLCEQVAKTSLCTLGARSLFLLRPDMLLCRQEKAWLLDAKWKKLCRDARRGFGISQADMYQLFAYGHQYLSGVGDLALIYPLHGGFPESAEPLCFSPSLRLWLLAFDMEKDRLLIPSSCPIGEAFDY